MCVVFVADKRKPTEDELHRMSLINPHGAGIATRKDGRIFWEKGLNLEQMIERVAAATMPFVGHFRIASVGDKTDDLTHPFPIEREVRNDLTGNTPTAVLFHNGTWGQWRDKGFDATVKNRVKVPDGKWSDTRMMAWLAHLHSTNILEFIDEKVIVYGINKIEIFHPDGWFRVNDLLVSNRFWENRHIPTVGQSRVAVEDEDWEGFYGGSGQRSSASVCFYGNCKEVPLVGTRYCADHAQICKHPQCSKATEPGRVWCHLHGCRWARCGNMKGGPNTDLCAEHQPMCTAQMCSRPREIGEKFCLSHLIPRPADASAIVVAEVLESTGGDSTPVPFRNGGEVVQGGTPDADGAAESQATVGRVGDTNSATAAAILEESRRYSVSMNPKKFQTPHIRLIAPLDASISKLVM